jgi:hypothetical protein
MSAPADGGNAGKSAVLEAHVAACAECRSAPPSLDGVAALLSAAAVPIDAARLSRLTLTRLQPELARRAVAGLWRKVAAALLLALVPLPAVLAYDAYLLRAAYAVISALLPATLAACVVFSYAAFLVLLFAATYAAIPLFLANRKAAAPAAF